MTLTKLIRLISLPIRALGCLIRYYLDLDLISALHPEIKAQLRTGTRNVIYTSEYAEMVYVLSLGMSWFDLCFFDMLKVKSKHNMFQEIQQKDMRLKFNPENGRAERHARSVRILMQDLVRRICWIEVARTYPTGITVEKVQEFALKETLKEGELPIRGCVRVMRQEATPLWKKILSRPINPKLFKPLWQGYSYGEETPSEPVAQESSVYHKVLSVVITYIFELITNEHIGLGEPFEGEVVILKDDGGEGDAKDNWVKIHLKCVSLD